MTVDLSEFHSRRRPTGKRCALKVARDDMNEEQLAKLNAALEEMDISSRVISEVLDRWGYIVGPQSISRHRRQECACD
jgi:uncharacterized protein YutD